MKNLLFILLCFPLLVLSQEEKRLALVIGNANYDKGELKNPVNDALLITETLKQLDFDVILDTNLVYKRSFHETIRAFGNKRPDYDVAFVYYAGHGIQVGSENYLLPTKEVFKSEYDVQDYGVNVQDIMRYLTGMSNKVNILILDACRDNPFEGNWNATRSLKGGGLAKIPPPTGSLIAFSTDVGNTAADGTGANSTYCKSLVENILLENTSLDQVFRNVRQDVLEKTNGSQRPIESSQLTGSTFYLNKTFSIYNSNVEEVLNESNRLFLSGNQYESIEVLHKAAEFFGANGDIVGAINLRKKVLELYHFEFKNKSNEIHLFPLVLNPRNSEDIEMFLDVKSYDIYVENLMFFCESFVESSKNNITYSSINSYLNFTRYYSRIAIDNYIGVDLIKSKTTLPFNNWASIVEYEKRYSDLSNQISSKITDNESLNLIYKFWNYKLQYSQLRTFGRKKIEPQLTKVDINNFSTEYYKDFYTFIDSVEANVHKFYLFDLDRELLTFDKAVFFEDKVLFQTKEKYPFLDRELNRLVIDLSLYFESKESINFGTQSFLRASKKDYSDPYSRGFNITDTNIDLDIQWHFLALHHLLSANVFFNGRDHENTIKLISLLEDLDTYHYTLFKYMEEIIDTKNKTKQAEKLKLLANFLKQTNYRLDGVSDPFYMRLIDSENNLKDDFLDVLKDWNSKFPPHFGEYVDLVLATSNDELTENQMESFKLSNNWYYTFQHAIAKIFLENALQANDSLSFRVSEIIQYQIDPVSEYWETLLPDHNYELLLKKNDMEIRSGSAYFMWQEYINQLLNQLPNDNENKCILLLNKIRLKTLVSTTSESYIWDLEDIINDFESLFLCIDNTNSTLLKLIVIKDCKRFLSLFGDFVASISVKDDLRESIEIYTKEYPGKNVNKLKKRLEDLLSTIN